MNPDTAAGQITPPGRAFWSGVLAELPLLLGVAPFALIYGVLAVNVGIPPVQAQAMSVLLFAGSAQFLVAQMIAAGTPAVVLVLAIVVVNLRHALYSASLAPYYQRLSRGWKALLAYLLVDEAYAVIITHYEKEGDTPSGRWFALGVGLALCTTWLCFTAAGVFLGAAVPSSWPLDFALPLTFIALVVPALKDRPSRGAALAAGLAAVALYSLPYKLGILAAALTGIAFGLWLEARK